MSENWQKNDDLKKLSKSSLNILEQWRQAPLRRFLVDKESKSLGQLVGGILNKYRSQSIPDKKLIAKAWKQAVGIQLAELSSPQKITHRTLVIAVKHPAVQQEISMLNQKKIIMRLNKNLPNKIANIRYVNG